MRIRINQANVIEQTIHRSVQETIELEFRKPVVDQETVIEAVSRHVSSDLLDLIEFEEKDLSVPKR